VHNLAPWPYSFTAERPGATLNSILRFLNWSQSVAILVAPSIEDFTLARQASAPPADIQVPVELLIQLLLLGIEFRHILLLGLLHC
jgi:hypothetical protein